ncbi:MAG: hypothetical protein ACJ74Q_14970 [Pyrinomonadaceae bacterium]
MSAAEPRRNEAAHHPFPGHAPGGESGLDFEALRRGAEAATEGGDDRSKKDRILALYDAGVTDVAELVVQTKARPSYIGQVLRANRGVPYFDLYTSSSDDGQQPNVYATYMRGVLSFKSAEAARESVKKIETLYDFFGRLNDRAGQHEMMSLALKGLNRARWSGKADAAQEFLRFLWVTSLA